MYVCNDPTLFTTKSFNTSLPILGQTVSAVLIEYSLLGIMYWLSVYWYSPDSNQILNYIVMYHIMSYITCESQWHQLVVALKNGFLGAQSIGGSQSPLSDTPVKSSQCPIMETGYAPTAAFTFWGCNGRERVHVRGLPALHHGLAHDLQVRVGFIVAGSGVMPGALAVLSLWEYGLGGGGHVVLVQRRRLLLLFGSGKRFLHAVSPHRRGWKAGSGNLYGVQKCWHRGSLTTGQPTFPEERLWRPRSSTDRSSHSAANERLTFLGQLAWRNKCHSFEWEWCRSSLYNRYVQCSLSN